MDDPPVSVFVTGANGFMGRALTERYRSAGVDVSGVDVTADERADVLAEAAPLGLVLGVLVLPELVVPLAPVDDVLAAHLAQEVGPLLRRHHTHGGAATVQDRQ